MGRSLCHTGKKHEPMSLPSIDLSSILLLSYVITFLLGARGLTMHLRDGVGEEVNVPTGSHSTPEVGL